MANKTKTNKAAKQVQDVITNAGLLLMTAAVTSSMIEVPEHSTKVILPAQPVFEFANPGSQPGNQEVQSTTLRREREETGPHYVSYTVAQRTPGRHGKI